MPAALRRHPQGTCCIISCPTKSILDIVVFFKSAVVLRFPTPSQAQPVRQDELYPGMIVTMTSFKTFEKTVFSSLTGAIMTRCTIRGQGKEHQNICSYVAFTQESLNIF